MSTDFGAELREVNGAAEHDRLLVNFSPAVPPEQAEPQLGSPPD